jgi:hypothetical protein
MTQRRIAWVDTTNLVNHIPGSGTGAFACTLHVREANSEAALPGALLRVMNSEETNTAALARSDVDGRTVTSLDAATYHVYAYLNGHLFESIPDTVVVTTSGACDTIWATRFDPGAPAQAGLCRVYGFVRSLGSENLSDVRVTAAVLTTPLRWGDVVISPYMVSATSDTSGHWYLDLIPSGELTPANTVYDFTIYDQSGTILRKQLAVPDSVSCLFDW